MLKLDKEVVFKVLIQGYRKFEEGKWGLQGLEHFESMEKKCSHTIKLGNPQNRKV
jgi:hypothetical protein